MRAPTRNFSTEVRLQKPKYLPCGEGESNFPVWGFSGRNLHYAALFAIFYLLLVLPFVPD